MYIFSNESENSLIVLDSAHTSFHPASRKYLTGGVLTGLNTKQDAVKLRDVIDLCKIVKMLAKNKKEQSQKHLHIFVLITTWLRNNDSN